MRPFAVLPGSRLLLGLFVLLALPLAAPARAQQPRPLLVGYFGQWGVYDGIFPNDLVKSGAAARLDQINYAQGFVTGGHCSVADPKADLNLTLSAANSVDGRPDLPSAPFRGNFHQLVLLKRRFPHLKILISLEGKAEDFAADAQPAARPAFVRSCVDTFLRGGFLPAGLSRKQQREARSLFDGIDLDWEYPHQEDAGNFLALLSDLRSSMDHLRPGLRLTVAVGPSPRMYPGVDMAEVARIVQEVGIMNYDYNGPWNPTTGLLAPLYSPDDNKHGGSVERTLEAYRDAGIPSSRMLMGIPFYGYGWKAVSTDSHGLFQHGESIRGDRPFRFFAPLASAALPEEPLAPATSTVPTGAAGATEGPASPSAATAAPTSGPTNAVIPTGAAGGVEGPASPSVAATAATAGSTNAVISTGAQRSGETPVLASAPNLTPSASTAAPAKSPTTVATPFRIYRDPRSQGPWLYDGDTFWTYEDSTSVRFKAAFALDQHLGGLMIWELGEDSPEGTLIRAARARLDQGPSPKPTPTSSHGSAQASSQTSRQTGNHAGGQTGNQTASRQ